MGKGVALLDGAKIARAKARFHAWWEGIDPPPETAAEGETSPADAAPATESPQPQPQTPPPAPAPPRLIALARLWGEGRTAPEEQSRLGGLLSSLAAPSDARLLLLGAAPAHLAEVRALHAGPIEAYEWRPDLLPAVAAAGAATKIVVAACALDGAGLEAGAQGLLSCDELTFAPDAAAFLRACCSALQPAGSGVFETYVGEEDERTASAFATACAPVSIKTRAVLRAAIEAAGFELTGEEDRTEAHAAAAREGFRRFSERARERVVEPLAPGVAQELAWEAACWRLRLTLLSERAIERRAFRVRRPEAKPVKRGLLARLMPKPGKRPA